MFKSSPIASTHNSHESIRMVAQILAGALLIALCAQIRIALPFTPVPITLQTLAVIVVGGLFGSRDGALSVLAYLGLALSGFPVLSGGRIDPLFLASPVAGYLIGFALQAYITGWFCERMHKLNPATVYAGMMAGVVAMYACGVVWLGQFVGFGNVAFLGIFPFLPGDICKAIIAYIILKRYGRVPR